MRTHSLAARCLAALVASKCSIVHEVPKRAQRIGSRLFGCIDACLHDLGEYLQPLMQDLLLSGVCSLGVGSCLVDHSAGSVPVGWTLSANQMTPDARQCILDRIVVVTFSTIQNFFWRLAC